MNYSLSARMLRSRLVLAANTAICRPTVTAGRLLVASSRPMSSSSSSSDNGTGSVTVRIVSCYFYALSFKGGGQELSLFLRSLTNYHFYLCFIYICVHILSSQLQYSGGQATQGQGGWYGSGGARVITAADVDTAGRDKVLAMAADVQTMQSTAKELALLENLLLSEQESAAGGVTNKTIELKNSMKKLITSPDLNEALNNLEIQGEPVWGLSSEEREMIGYLREKINE